MLSGSARSGPHRSRRAVLGLIAALPVAVAGCGFRPLHAPGMPAAASRGRIAVDPVPGATGFALQERLTERLGVATPPSHRLAVDLDIRVAGAALTEDSITTRYIVLGTAAFSLFPPGAAAPVLSESVAARTGYSVPATDTASAFAARTAARDAELRVARDLADRIAMRLAVTAGTWAAP